MNAMTRKSAIWAFLIAAAVIGGVVSYWASPDPDGLDRSIEDHGLQPADESEQPAARSEDAEQDAAEASSPLADYQVAGVSNEFVSNSVAGLIGSLLVLVVMLAMGYLLARRHRAAPVAASGGSPPRDKA